MAPISKQESTAILTVQPRMPTRLSTRTSTSTATSMLRKIVLHTTKDKRKADQLSPPKGRNTKRSAFNDITNAENTAAITSMKGKQATTVKVAGNNKETVVAKPIAREPLKPLSNNKEGPRVLTQGKIKVAPAVARVRGTIRQVSAGNQENVDPTHKGKTALQKSLQKENEIVKLKAKQSLSVVVEDVEKVQIQEKKQETIDIVVVETEKITSKTVVQEVKALVKVDTTNDEDSSLYTSALETLPEEDSLVILTPLVKDREVKKPVVNVNAAQSPKPPVGVDDFDLENIEDPLQVSIYAMDIFNYLKSRENMYKVRDYMGDQKVITRWMRALLVDWMVDVQEHFELNHETLYLAVKILDLYLNKHTATKETLQLIGAAALFIASKFDERLPPLIEDFLYVCENVYSRDELVKMEVELFREVDFCLGMPISYRFLRRFARCCKTSMPILTLARYILESSLMEYQFVSESESAMACAALYLALRMSNVESGWSPTLEYYTGYKLEQFRHLVLQFNEMLHRKPREQLKTVRTKYTHKIFFEVAKTALLDNNKL